jgi:oligopeptide transport system permease protein
VVRDVGLRQPHEEGACPRLGLTVLVFALRRLLWTIPVLLVVFTITFFMLRAIGGNPFRHGPLLGHGNPAWAKYNDPQPEAIASNLARKYGLDRPWYRQYADYLTGVATFDLGPSLTYRNRTVNEIVREQSAPTLQIGLLAFVLAVGIGVPLGVLAAMRAGTGVDYGARLLSGVGIAAPSFLLATLLIYVVSVRLGWLPTSGWQPGLRHGLLPAIALALLPLAYIVRLVRASMLETLREDYVRAAVAKGLRWKTVVARHVLRNSLIPVVTAAGPLFGFLVTGSFVIESVFAIPGIGRYYVSAVAARDYPLVLGLTLLLATIVVLVNLAVDLLYGVLDPRVREAR